MSQPQRKAIRLAGSQYHSSGLYFVTICAYLQQPLLGRPKEGTITLTDIGNYVARCWLEQSDRYSGIVPRSFVVMPNHFHGIVEKTPCDHAGDSTLALPDVIRNFKALTAHEHYEKSTHQKLWQRGYYEHVIRDDRDLARIEAYIANNPSTWARDKYYLDFE